MWHPSFLPSASGAASFPCAWVRLLRGCLLPPLSLTLPSTWPAHLPDHFPHLPPLGGPATPSSCPGRLTKFKVIKQVILHPLGSPQPRSNLTVLLGDVSGGRSPWPSSPRNYDDAALPIRLPIPLAPDALMSPWASHSFLRPPDKRNKWGQGAGWELQGFGKMLRYPQGDFAEGLRQHQE